MSGSILFGQVAARVQYVELTCARCDRAWELDLKAEAADFDPDVPFWHLWEELNAACPNQNDAGVYNRCQLRALVLPELQL